MRSRRKSSQKLAKRKTLVSFSTSPPPPPLKWTEIAIRASSFHWGKEVLTLIFQSLAKRNCALKSCWETSDLWKMENHKPCTRRKEVSVMKGEICVSIKLAARPSFNRFAAERGVHSLRAANFFFFFNLALRRRSRPPSPQTNTLRVASFCELLRWPLRKNFCYCSWALNGICLIMKANEWNNSGHMKAYTVSPKFSQKKKSFRVCECSSTRNCITTCITIMIKVWELLRSIPSIVSMCLLSCYDNNYWINLLSWFCTG